MQTAVSGAPKKRVLPMALILGIVVSLIISLTPAYALAAPTRYPDNLVAGTIENLAALPEGTVRLRLLPQDPEVQWSEFPETAVNRASGAYRIADVPFGSYALKLEVLQGDSSPGSEPMAIHTQFLKESGKHFIDLRPDKGKPFVSRASAPSATLSGQVSRQGASSTGRASLSATVYERLDGRWLPLQEVSSVSEVLDYNLPYVSPGQYTVKFKGGPAACVVASVPEGFVADQDFRDTMACGFQDEWWQGAYAQSAAKVISIRSGQQLTGIDAVLETNHVDVKRDRKFAADIDWMYQRGISTGSRGVNGNVYRPTLSVTREAMAAFIYRYAGSPDFTAPSNPSFTDVPSTEKFYKEIEWMKSAKLTTGIKDGSKLKYAPKDSISREAMAAFLYRLAGRPGVDPAAAKSFLDVPGGHKFAREIAWMSGTGVTTGWNTPQGLAFQPLEPVKRDAMAAFLHRYDNKP